MGIEMYDSRREAQVSSIPRQTVRAAVDTPRRRDDEPGELADLDRW